MSDVFRDHGSAIPPSMVNQELYERSMAYSQEVGGALESSVLDDFDKSIFRRVLRQNAGYEPGGTFYNRIGETFAQQSEVPAEQLFDIGIDLAGHITASSNNPRGVVLDYFNSLYQITNYSTWFYWQLPFSKGCRSEGKFTS